MFMNIYMTHQEQENYARGFIDALDELHRRQGIPSHVIKKEKNDDAMFYNNASDNKGNEVLHQLHSDHNQHLYSDMSDISNNNALFFNNNKITSETSNNNTTTPLLTFNNNNSSQFSQFSSFSTNNNLPSINYNIADNHNSSLLTNPDISLNENIFSKDISPSLSPFPILPPAQTLLTRSPKQIPQSTPIQLDSKPFINSSPHENIKHLYNKQAIKRTADMAKLTSSMPPSNEDHTNQTVPHLLSSPLSSTSPLSISPSDEVDRLEIKRARNRLAAQKCRSRKLERIAVLTARVEELKHQNAALEVMRSDVVGSIEKLHQQLLQHSKCDTAVPSALQHKSGLCWWLYYSSICWLWKVCCVIFIMFKWFFKMVKWLGNCNQVVIKRYRHLQL